MNDIAAGLMLFIALFGPSIIIARIGHVAYRAIRFKINPDWRQIK